MKKSELLSPAGSFKSMRYAFAYGADAVYAGQPRYSLRVRNNEFRHENLAEAINEAHSQGKQFFIASNIAPHNDKVKTYLRDLEPVIAAGPDALIMSDPGLIMMVREKWPSIPVHLSVQSNAVNFATVKFWQSLGLTRIILSRELSLKEVAQIREECPDIELEVFVHGALCMAYSGRCLLSGYMNHRDANQGACTNACRWQYKAAPAQQDEWGNIEKIGSDAEAPQLGIGKPTQQTVVLQETQRPDSHIPMFEDEHGTYIMNSKDLRAIQHVKTLMEMGIDCLKIEGRTKSHFYAARTAQAYRRAIDDALNGKAFDLQLMDDLEAVTTRGYTEGFFRRHVHDEYQIYEDGQVNVEKKQFVGEVIEYDAQKGKALVDVKNRFEVGSTLEIMTPQGNFTYPVTHIENKAGESMEAAPGSGHQVWIPIESSLEAMQFSLLLGPRVSQ